MARVLFMVRYEIFSASHGPPTTFSEFIKFSFRFLVSWKKFSSFPDDWKRMRDNDPPRKLPKIVWNISPSLLKRISNWFSGYFWKFTILESIWVMDSQEWSHILRNSFRSRDNISYHYGERIFKIGHLETTYGQTTLTSSVQIFLEVFEYFKSFAGFSANSILRTRKAEIPYKWRFGIRYI